MSRLRRFAENAGLVRMLQFGVVLVFIGLALRRDLVTGNWTITIPLLAAVFAVAFLIRDFLVDNLSWIRWVMNVAVLAGVFVSVLSRKGLADSPAVQIAIVGCLGFYMSCYFWILSDERIAFER